MDIIMDDPLVTLLERLNLTELQTLRNANPVDLQREIDEAITRNPVIPTKAQFGNLPANGAAKYAVLKKDTLSLVRASDLEVSSIEAFDDYDLSENIVRRIIFSDDVERIFIGKSYGSKENIYGGTQNRFGSKYRGLNYFHFIIVAIFEDEEKALELEHNLHLELGRLDKFDESAYNTKGGTSRQDRDYWVVYLAIKYV